MNGFVVFLIWAALLLLAVPYTRSIRHPDQKFFAAYMIFVVVFTASAFTLFMLLLRFGSAVFGPDALESPLAATILVLGAVLPSLWIGSLLAAKPPRNAPPL